MNLRHHFVVSRTQALGGHRATRSPFTFWKSKILKPVTLEAPEFIRASSESVALCTKRTHPYEMTYCPLLSWRSP